MGLLGGTLVDCTRDATSAPAARGGYLVFETDLHVHTRFSDGVLSPFEVVLTAERQGLHALAVTEHNMAFPAKLAAWLSHRIGGPTVIVGEEVTSRGYHLLALGIRERVAPYADVREAVRAVHAQGGVAIAAHPVARYHAVFSGVDLDGAEVVHPVAFGGAVGAEFRWEDMLTFYQAQAHPGFAAVGASDYHFFRLLGVCRTYVFAHDASEASLIDALRAGRSVTIAPDGRRFGNAVLIDALDREPLPPRRSTVGYAPEGALDRVARFTAWLGMLALVLIRLRRSANGSR
jgi:predicted metal-dependent phosphoesterase TrpH